jgi:hypothetical protein
MYPEDMRIVLNIDEKFVMAGRNNREARKNGFLKKGCRPSIIEQNYQCTPFEKELR